MVDKPKPDHSVVYARFAATGENAVTVTRFALQSCAREILPNERVAQCLRIPIPLSDRVDVFLKEETRKAFYKNLIVCGSVWHCPVCAAKITEVRRNELHDAYLRWQGSIALCTYTMSHNVSQSLETLLDAILGAFRDLRSWRSWKELKEHFGAFGSVRSLEVTHGENGWHVHMHELFFFVNELTNEGAGKLEWRLRSLWREALDKQGQSCDYSRGVTLKIAHDEVSQYVAKFGTEVPDQKIWTPAHEITKFPSKRGKNGGRTPLQLLSDYMEGDTAARHIWREYALTFKGRHQLQWSRDLRKALKLGAQVSDEAAAEETRENSILLASLKREEWQSILRADVRGELLVKASILPEENFNAWLYEIIEKYR